MRKKKLLWELLKVYIPRSSHNLTELEALAAGPKNLFVKTFAGISEVSLLESSNLRTQQISVQWLHTETVQHGGLRALVLELTWLLLAALSAVSCVTSDKLPTSLSQFSVQLDYEHLPTQVVPRVK